MAAANLLTALLNMYTTPSVDFDRVDAFVLAPSAHPGWPCSHLSGITELELARDEGELGLSFLPNLCSVLATGLPSWPRCWGAAPQQPGPRAAAHGGAAGGPCCGCWSWPFGAASARRGIRILRGEVAAEVPMLAVGLPSAALQAPPPASSERCLVVDVGRSREAAGLRAEHAGAAVGAEEAGGALE
ncbi:uncharacterized protein LOC120686926 [Panicum virgatum]|uniref:uncharacterized protein LOC120686926 n=1 Tax=Panicum virgatum TaxID=38727 RepID=UPI0019D51AE2|nr:uncharacterized protein LOC120686926 [Panicum virgatum]